METMTRTEAREEVFHLLFETEFHKDCEPKEVYNLANEARDFEANCDRHQLEYIRKVYFGVLEKSDEIDELISRHSNGWRTDRIAPVSRSILRLCIYEMQYVDDVPPAVAINEAVNLAKKYDEEKARVFLNGILHGIKTELEAGKVTQ